MNSFEAKFFQKYVPEGHKIKDIAHNHPLNIIGHLFLWMGLGVFIPVFIYYYSFSISELIPFMFLEVYLYILYIKIIYDIFDRYNDVWIITNKGVVELDWRLLRTRVQTIEYNDIEGMEVQHNGLIDKMLNKGDLVIHKIGEESFALYDAISPFKKLNIIEELKEKSYHDDENEYGGERFDIIMDALGGVVENYLEKKGKTDEEIRKANEYIERYQDDENTLDLR